MGDDSSRIVITRSLRGPMRQRKTVASSKLSTLTHTHTHEYTHTRTDTHTHTHILTQTCRFTYTRWLGSLSVYVSLPSLSFFLSLSICLSPLSLCLPFSLYVSLSLFLPAQAVNCVVFSAPCEISFLPLCWTVLTGHKRRKRLQTPPSVNCGAGLRFLIRVTHHCPSEPMCRGIGR